MLKSLKVLQLTLAPLTGVLLLVSAATQLTGCVVRAGVAVPPPPRVYVAPPPAPEYVAPAVEVDLQANEAPPPLPEYEQPPCPVEGYHWTPGYWAFAAGSYYWVPGTWVQPPRVGFLWTPAYWGFVGGVYMFHAGYWGPHVGFYGGVNYGFGYGGVGFAGGRWVGNSFAYNQSVTNVNVTVVHNTYNETVINNNVNVNRVSYSGGAGGVAAMPTREEKMAAREQHVPVTPVQRQHIQQAVANPALSAKANGGHPSIAATPRPAAFNAPGVVGARGAVPAAPHAAAQNGIHPGPHAAAQNGIRPGAPLAPGTHPTPGAHPVVNAQPAPGAHAPPYAAIHPQPANVKATAPAGNAVKPNPKTPPTQNKKREEIAAR